jgi:cell division protein FtsQ
MSMNWKKIGILTADIILGVYLVLAITAFNCLDDQNTVCSEVKINITDGAGNGFLNVNEVKMQLQHAKIYPLGDRMNDVCTRQIEETLLKSPLVEHVECYKTHSGRVFINLTQRIAVMRIMANNGESYYIDNLGTIIPSNNNSTDLVVATGDIKRKYAQTALKQFGLLLLDDPFWHSQIEQINVLPDGSVEMIPRVGDHIVYLGQPTHLKEKLTRLEKFYRYGLSKAGWNKYSYINMEFNNQIICKKRKGC